MRRRSLMQRLDDMDRRGVWAFTPATFSTVIDEPDPAYLKLRMKRLADQGILTRAARGIYVNPRARALPSDVRGGLLRFLRPREVTYVSLESRLSALGAIPQTTMTLTCMTTGSPGRFDTPWGAIELTHTDREIAVGLDVSARDDGVLGASAERAARDLRRVGRNVDLIDEAALAQAIAETAAP